MVATANDSWNDFPYLSLRSARLLQTVEAFVDGHYYHARRLSSSSVKQTRSTVKKKGSDGGGTKDMELFNIIHQSIGSIVWIIVVIFAIIALLAKYQVKC